MLCQNFETDVIPHRLIGEIVPGGFGHLRYNEWIPEPYAESVDPRTITGMFFDYNNLGRVIVATWMRQIYWPSWSTKWTAFDAETGAFLAHLPWSGGFYAAQVYQGAGGELYISQITGPIIPLDPNYQYLEDQTIYPATFGAVSLRSLVVDRSRDRMICRKDSDRGVSIFRFSTAELLAYHDFCETVVDVCYAEGSTVYILLNDHTIVGFDYELDVIFQGTRLPPVDDISTMRVSYDRRYRRILAVAYSPDNPDGSSTISVKGYRNIPIASYACKPIPLTRARVGEATEVLYKVVGDRGEGLLGSVIAETTDTSAEVVQEIVGLDTDGEGVGEVQGLAEGVETISVSSEVACQL